MQCTARRWYSFCLITLEEILYIFVFYVLVFRFVPTISGDDNRSSSSPPPSPRRLLMLLHNSAPLYINWIVFIGTLVVVGLVQICFFRSVFEKAKGIPDAWSLQQLSDITSKYNFTEKDNKGEIRKCKKCFKVKPDRAHHCSRCDRCILKMDHHCPFLANCVGFSNYKYFVLLLLWTLMLAIETLVCGSYHIYDRVTKPKPTVLDYYIVAVTFLAVVVLLVLLPFTGTHLGLILRNSTTLEHLEKRSRYANPYHLGWYKNIQQVFGANPFFWLLPVGTYQGDGVLFPALQETSSLLLHT